jgi:AraC family transcriptional regulator
MVDRVQTNVYNKGREEGTMDIAIRSRRSSTVACVSHTGFSSGISGAFARLLSGMGGPGASGRLLTIFHDDPAVSPARQRAAAAVELDDRCASPGSPVETGSLPAGTYAVLEHTGPYSELPAAWIAFAAEIAERGMKASRGPRFEVYLNSPEDVPERDLLAELHLPITQ